MSETMTAERRAQMIAKLRNERHIGLERTSVLSYQQAGLVADELARVAELEARLAGAEQVCTNHLPAMAMAAKRMQDAEKKTAALEARLEIADRLADACGGAPRGRRVYKALDAYRAGKQVAT